MATNVYTDEEIRVLDEMKELSNNTLDDDDIYEMMEANNFNEAAVKREVLKYVEKIRRKGSADHQWTVVTKTKDGKEEIKKTTKVLNEVKDPEKKSKKVRKQHDKNYYNDKQNYNNNAYTYSSYDNYNYDNTYEFNYGKSYNNYSNDQVDYSYKAYDNSYNKKGYIKKGYTDYGYNKKPYNKKYNKNIYTELKEVDTEYKVENLPSQPQEVTLKKEDVLKTDIEVRVDKKHNNNYKQDSTTKRKEEKHSDKEDTSMEFDSLKKLIEEPIKKEPQVQHPIIHQNQNNQHQIQNQHNNQNQLHHQPQHQHQIQHQTPNQQIFKNTQIDNNVNQVDKFFENTDYGKKFPPWEKSSFHGKKPTFNETFTIYGQLNFFNGFLDPNMMKLAMMGMGMPLYNMENINMQNPMDMQNFSYPQMNMILNQQQRNTHLNQGSGSMPGIQKNMYKNHN